MVTPMPRCDVPKCTTEALPGIRFCERHRQDFRNEMALLDSMLLRCPECGGEMPDGPATHQCP
jgi:hypothetical protein